MFTRVFYIDVNLAVLYADQNIITLYSYKIDFMAFSFWLSGKSTV